METSPDGDRRATRASLEAGPRRDLDAIASRLARSTPVVRRNARRVYDRFLKANRVADGIASYGAVVELVLGARDCGTEGNDHVTGTPRNDPSTPITIERTQPATHTASARIVLG